MAETLDRLIALWSGLEAPLKWGTLGVAASLVLLVFLFAVVRISRYVQRGWRRVLFVVGCVCVAFALVFGIWASVLPEPERVSFVLSHQIVRVCAALFGTFSIIILMSLGLPLGLDQLERRSFVSFVAARHVRASKSGFLTVISILSI